MNGIMKIIKSLEESVLLIKEVRKTSKNEARKQRGGFLGMLFCTLGTCLLGNLQTGRRVTRDGKGQVRAGEGATATSQGRSKTKAGQGF